LTERTLLGCALRQRETTPRSRSLHDRQVSRSYLGDEIADDFRCLTATISESKPCDRRLPSRRHRHHEDGRLLHLMVETAGQALPKPAAPPSNAAVAIGRAESLCKILGHTGAIAFSRRGDPATGDFSDATSITSTFPQQGECEKSAFLTRPTVPYAIRYFV
jgi:hypothetical protein